MAKPSLLFPRQTAEWLGIAISARFAPCPGPPSIRSGSGRRAPPRGRGPKGSRGSGGSASSPGAAAGAPRGRQGLASACSLGGLESVAVTPSHHPHPGPGWRWAASCVPDEAHRVKGGRLVMPSAFPRADAEPSWGPSSAALTPCPWMGKRRDQSKETGIKGSSVIG